MFQRRSLNGDTINEGVCPLDCGFDVVPMSVFIVKGHLASLAKAARRLWKCQGVYDEIDVLLKSTSDANEEHLNGAT